jgi:hypothetical protein
MAAPLQKPDILAAFSSRAEKSVLRHQDGQHHTGTFACGSGATEAELDGDHGPVPRALVNRREPALMLIPRQQEWNAMPTSSAARFTPMMKMRSFPARTPGALVFFGVTFQ